MTSGRALSPAPQAQNDTVESAMLKDVTVPEAQEVLSHLNINESEKNRHCNLIVMVKLPLSYHMVPAVVMKIL